LNERAVKELGLSSPIGNQIYISDKEYSIIGVIQDFHSVPKVMSIPPLILKLKENNNNYTFIKLNSNKSGNPEQSITANVKHIENVLKGFKPDLPLEYDFLARYEIEEEKSYKIIGKLSLVFTILGIIIACIGLFGLSSFLTQQRTKEIGIRKIMGASPGRLLRILSKEYFILLLIANVIAWPLAYQSLKGLFSLYAYSIDISIWFFLGTGIFTVFLVILTVSVQSLKLVQKNPAQSLRYE
jgi:ABC-type antimicrobial peptide transport system permease subunit